MVGSAGITGRFIGAARWQRGQFTALGNLPNGTPTVVAYDINKKAEIVGTAGSIGSTGLTAFIYRDAQALPLGDLPGGADDSTAYAINDRRQVVGTGVTDEGTRAFLWQDGAMMDLGVMPGTRYSLAFDINNRGQVVGIFEGFDGRGFGFIWEDGEMRVLPPLQGESASDARALNERGSVVGSSSSSNQFGQTAVIWRSGVPLDLNALIEPDDPLAMFVTLMGGTDINERGQIAAWGFDSRLGGASRGYLLTPTRVREHCK